MVVIWRVTLSLVDIRSALETLSASTFKGLKPPDKLVWLYLLALGEDHYSVRAVASALGISNETARLAMEALLARDLLEITQRGSGPRSHRLRAILPH
jgi:predicted DNA-binding transcriptional regulator